MNDQPPVKEPSRPEPQSIDLDQHARRCSICKHKDREIIESDFVNWRSISDLAREFRIRDRHSIYDHARAYRLFERRSRNISTALSYIIEQAETVRPSGSAVLEAIKLCSQLDDKGRWTRPTQIVRHEYAPGLEPAPKSPANVLAPAREKSKSGSPQIPEPKSV
jgi:hypothetical protein